jgi:cation diffusion facilitator family transporter
VNLDSERAEREKAVVALSSVVAAVFLTGLKLAVGLLTGSLGILSEAAHSGLDLVAAFITFLAVRASARPADADHLYGHGKVESFSALIETLLLLLTCSWIVYEAIQRLAFKTVEIDANAWAFAVMGISIIIDISRSRALYRIARRHGSQALEADALHFSTDVWSSAAVIAGLVLVRLGELVGQRALFSRADALAALGVAAVVIVASYRLGRRTVDVLVDRAPSGLPGKIEAVVKGVEGVHACRRLRVRRAGPAVFVDMTLELERSLPLERAHAISAAVEERVQEIVPNADLVIHIEPARGEAETAVDRIRAIANASGLAVHDLRVHEVKGRLYANLHLEVDDRLRLKEAHQLASELEEAVRTQVPGIAEIATHIEPRSERTSRGREAPQALPRIEAALAELVPRIPGLRDCHEIRAREAEGRLFVSLHCLFDGLLTLEEVHRASGELEVGLKERIPGLEQVLVHVEPAADLTD